MDQPCELYLCVSAAAAPTGRALEALIDGARPSAMLVTEMPGAEQSVLSELMAAARSQNVAILFAEDWQLAGQLGADGVHLQPDAERLKTARAEFGAGGVVGVSCRLSRHEAMTMAEAGADYVAFGELNGDTAVAEPDPLADMIGWWSALFEIPCIAWLGKDADISDARRLIEAGADFLAVDASSEDRVRELAGLIREIEDKA